MSGFSQAHIVGYEDGKVIRPQLLGKEKGEAARIEGIRQAKNDEMAKRQEEAKDKEEIEEKDTEEAERAKVKRIPKMPTQQEIDEHCATHVPFRDWCEYCVHGKAKDDPHYRAKKDREIMVPEIDIDYMWLKGKFPFMDKEESGQPIMIVKDRETKFKRAVMIPAKGVEAYAVKTLVNDLQRLFGYSQIVLTSDQEASIIALKNSAKREMNGVDIQMKESAVDEHQANSQVESAVRLVQEQVRTMRLAIEARYNTTLKESDAIWPWLIMEAANLLNRYQVGTDGKTCLLYTSPSPRDGLLSRMPSSA